MRNKISQNLQNTNDWQVVNPDQQASNQNAGSNSGWQIVNPDPSLLDKIGQFAESIPTGIVQGYENLIPKTGTAPISAGGMPVDISAFSSQAKPATISSDPNLAGTMGIPNTLANQIGGYIGEYGQLGKAGFDIGKLGLKGIGNTLTKIPGMFESSRISKAISKLEPLPEEPSSPKSFHEFPVTHESLQAASKLNAARTALNSAVGEKGVHGAIAKDYLNKLNNARNMYQPAFDIHGDKLPDFLKKPEKSGNYEMGDKFIEGTESYATPKSQLSIFNRASPQDKLTLIKGGYIKESGQKDPISSWLNPDEERLGSSYASTQYKNFAKNPSIKNIYDLKENIDRRAASLPASSEKFGLQELSKKLNNDGIINPLKELDTKYGTNTAQPYLGADKYFRENVGPYRANKAIYNVATGVDKTLPLDKLSGAIDKAQRTPSKYRFDQNTGLPLSQIPENHELSTVFKPHIDNLYSDFNDAQNNYNSAQESNNLLKKYYSDQDKLNMQDYQTKMKNYQNALKNRQQQIDAILNKPSLMGKIAKHVTKKAIHIGTGGWLPLE